MNNDSTPVALPLRDLKGITFASENDVVCGMPVKAGVKDTAQYKDKVYGFCSKECKDEFLKNPDSYLTSK
jgi:YHS domain-containing protein